MITEFGFFHKVGRRVENILEATQGLRLTKPKMDRDS